MKPRGIVAGGVSRRGWLATLFLLAGLSASTPSPAQPGAASAAASARTPALLVLTTLPETYARARARAFERVNPGVRVELMFQRPEQILSTLRAATPGQRPHVVWSASIESFAPAAAEGLLLGPDAEPLPYGAPAAPERNVTVRGQHLMRVALARPTGTAAPAWPERWQDLAQPGDCGSRLANPFSAAGGVASVIIEAALQDRGWEAGWSLLSALAASSAGSAGGGPQLSFVFEEAAKDAGIELRPAFTAIVRTRLALVSAGSRDSRLALRFQRFLTSDPLAAPATDSAATPVRASPAATAQYLSLDLALLESREPMLTAMARQWLVSHAPNLKQSCTALREARRLAQTGGDAAALEALDRARTRAFGPALSERVLSEESVLQAFSTQQREALRKPRVSALESQWAALAHERHAQAMNLIAATRPPGARLTP